MRRSVEAGELAALWVSAVYAPAYGTPRSLTLDSSAVPRSRVLSQSIWLIVLTDDGGLLD